jgi:hypothetical protein
MRPVQMVPAGLLLALAAPGHAQQAPAAPLPLFVEATERLGSPQPCADTQPGCYSSYVLLVDLDRDADLDIVFASGGGYYEPAEAEPMAVYLNDGKASFEESSATVTGGFTGRLRQVTAGDIDGDGDVDLVAPEGYGLQPDAVLINDGKQPPRFVDEGATRLGTSSRAGATRLGDLDGDGDLDLVITDWGDTPPESPGTAHVYLNDGAGHFEELARAVPQNTAMVGVGPIDVDLFDADGDFDLDLLLASRTGDSLLFENRGDARFDHRDVELAEQPGPYVYGPDACDVDGDGDLDLWLDNGGTEGLAEQLLINDGHGLMVDETAVRVQGDAKADDNEVQCVDIDDDGDLDALVASLGDNERVLGNDGRGHFAALPGVFPTVGDATLGLDVGDLDGDGRLDAVSAQGETGSYLNRLYLGGLTQQPDSQPPRIRAIEQAPREAGGKLWLRFAVADRATSDVGPRLAEARVEVRGGPTVAARFVGGDLFLAELPIAGRTLEARVCAVDMSGLETCSAEQSYVLEPAPAPEPPPEAEPEGSKASDCSLARGAGGADLVALLTLVLVRRRRG